MRTGVAVASIAGVCVLALAAHGVSRWALDTARSLHAARPPPPQHMSAAHRLVNGSGFDPARLWLDRQPWYARVPFGASYVNGSERPVRIETVHKSCGCMLMDDDLAGVELEPGARLEVCGEIETGPSAGVRRQEIALILDTGAIHRLEIDYQVYATYQCLPEALAATVSLGGAGAGPTVLRSVFRSSDAALVGDAVCDSPWMQAHLVPAPPDTEIVVALDPRYLAHGPNYGSVHLTTDDPGRPEFSIPVVVQAVAALRPVPEVAFLSAGESRVVTFLTAAGQVACVTTVESDTETVTAEISNDGQAVVIRAAAGAFGRAVVSVTAGGGLSSKVLVLESRAIGAQK
jgi:hypothetical protein